jgi:hypothetical protein
MDAFTFLGAQTLIKRTGNISDMSLNHRHLKSSSGTNVVNLDA